METNPSTGADATSRLPALDGLRAVAILLVVLHHLSNYVSPDGEAALFRTFAGTGWNGVFLFFVLSGFLVGSLAFRELATTGRLNVPRFWFRRFLRTWPLYFVLLFLNLWHLPTSPSPSLWTYLTFTQNLFSPKFFMQTWSLAVEEQFYLVLPLLLAVAWRFPRWRLFSGICLALFVASYLYRWLEGNGYYKFLHTPSVVDSLLIGLMIAYTFVFHPAVIERFKRYPHVCFALGLFFVYGSNFTQMNRFWQTNFCFGGLGIGFGLILLAALSDRFVFRRWLCSRPLRFVALVSYSIYLSHDKPLYYLARIGGMMGLDGWEMVFFLTPTVILASVLVGWLLYVAIERPGLVLRDSLWSRHATRMSLRNLGNLFGGRKELTESTPS